MRRLITVSLKQRIFVFIAGLVVLAAGQAFTRIVERTLPAEGVYHRFHGHGPIVVTQAMREGWAKAHPQKVQKLAPIAQAAPDVSLPMIARAFMYGAAAYAYIAQLSYSNSSKSGEASKTVAIRDLPLGVLPRGIDAQPLFELNNYNFRPVCAAFAAARGAGVFGLMLREQPSSFQATPENPLGAMVQLVMDKASVTVESALLSNDAALRAQLPDLENICGMPDGSIPSYLEHAHLNQVKIDQKESSAVAHTARQEAEKAVLYVLELDEAKQEYEKDQKSDRLEPFDLSEKKQLASLVAQALYIVYNDPASWQDLSDAQVLPAPRALAWAQASYLTYVDALRPLGGRNQPPEDLCRVWYDEHVGKNSRGGMEHEVLFMPVDQFLFQLMQLPRATNSKSVILRIAPK